MPEFLSPEWFDTADRAAGPGADDEAIVVRQRVTGTPWGDVMYLTHVTSGGTRRVTAGEKNYSLTLDTDYATAVEIHEGRMAIAPAVLSGRIKVDGDVRHVVALTRTQT